MSRFPKPMKISFAFLILFTLRCAEPTAPINYDRVREAAFNSLDEISKMSITEDWKNAEVQSGFYSPGNCRHNFTGDDNFSLCFIPIDSETKFTVNQPLAAMIFHTKDNPLIGPIIVIVDPAPVEAVGFVGRL